MIYSYIINAGGILMTMKKQTKQIIIFITSLIGIIILYTFIYSSFYLGNYIVQKQWISSNYNNHTYCDKCLWIEFYEGCNRYQTYYFKNQHEFDNRLDLGKVVNIRFNGDYVKSVDLAYKYQTKCFSEFDYTFHLFLCLIVLIFLILYVLILIKLKSEEI